MAAFDFRLRKRPQVMAEGQQASVPIQSLPMQTDADAVYLVRTQFQRSMGAGLVFWRSAAPSSTLLARRRGEHTGGSE